MKFSKYIGLATLCMCLNGCTDFIDNAPDDIITIDMIFDDKTRTEDWLAGVYQGIRDPYWDYTVTMRSRCWQTISLHRKAGYHIGVVTAD